MRKHSIPLLAQHESWISLDPIQGCPASCVYCYLEPAKLTRRVPGEPEDTPEHVYQKLSEYEYLNKFRFGDVSAGKNIPISIGDYTDMCLTPRNRQYLLLLLHEHKRRMPELPVCIVTKASLDQSFLEDLNQIGITIIFFISLSFLPPNFEKGTPPTQVRLANFKRIAQYANLNAVHFWRPVTSLSTPNRSAVVQQIDLLQIAGANVSVITGLKFGENLAQIFQSNEKHDFHDFFKDQLGKEHVKNEIFEPEIKEMLLDTARERFYPMYLHTSCAISYILKQPDYNATFRKPHLERRCLASTCPLAQRELCTNFRSRFAQPSEKMLEHVARYLGISPTAVTYSERKEIILVDRVLTQEEQTYLTQATSFPVRGKDLVPTLEWVGSINR